MLPTIAPHRAGARRPAVPRLYTTSEELGGLVQDYQLHRSKMEKHDRLLEILRLIAGGVWDRWRFTKERDDFVQDCMFLFFSRCLLKIDRHKKPHAYLTTCAKNHGLARLREGSKRQGAEEARRGQIIREQSYAVTHLFPNLD